MEGVSAIGFDLDHTLAIDNSLERVAFLRLLEVILAEGGDSLGTLGDELDWTNTLLKQQRHGEFSIDEAVRRFVQAHGITANDGHVRRFRETALGLIDDLVVPLPGVSKTLETLQRRGVAMAVLTNGWSPMQLRKARRAGFTGPVLVSSDIGVQKPALAAFEVLLRTMGASPQSSCYVGDDPEGDVAGAHAAGMQAVWIDWERKTYPSNLAPADRIIHQFPELLIAIPSAAEATKCAN